MPFQPPNEPFERVEQNGDPGPRSRRFLQMWVCRTKTRAVIAPPKTDVQAYGKYITTTSGCLFCHTTADERMMPIPGLEWAGDNEFCGPWGAVRSANLSPHETGMGGKTKENFIGLFRAFGGVEGELPAGARNTVMPWALYNKLSDEDLGMAYDYLKAQKPVANTVDKFPKNPRG